MTLTKKLISAFLAIIMVCSLAMPVFAEEEKSTLESLGETLDGVSKSLDFRRTDASGATVKLSKTSYVYNGKIRKPSVKVTLNGTALEKGMDFKITYPDNCKSVGNHKVKVEFVGMYEGADRELTFTIKPAKMPAATSVKKLKGKKAAVTVSWKKVTTNNKGYLIQLATDKKFKKNVKYAEAKKDKTSKTVKGLKSGKKYYVRVCSFTKVNGVKVPTKWSKAKTVKVK